MFRPTRPGGFFLMVLAAVAFCACTSHKDPLFDELHRTESGQRGPRVLVTQGRLPNGEPWLASTYRLRQNQICVDLVWLESNGHSSEGTCNDHRAIPILHSAVIRPSNTDDTLTYVIGFVSDTRARTLRLKGPDGSQDVRLISVKDAPGYVYFAARFTLVRGAQTADVLDTSGRILHTERFEG
jgi:hypothetical protein